MNDGIMDYGDATHMVWEQSTLLLLNHADDCLLLLMNEFTNQAMVNDLLPLEDDHITFQAKNVDTAAENEADCVITLCLTMIQHQEGKRNMGLDVK
eukprot:15327156-Ditylum_brightwellii.AAC.1